MNARTNARWILALSLAYVFAFFGVEKFLHPLLWIGWIPPWMEGALGLTRNQWLPIFGVFQILLAASLLVPKGRIQKFSAAIAAFFLLAVLTQTGLLNDIGVRDLGLLCAALALFVLTE